MHAMEPPKVGRELGMYTTWNVLAVVLALLGRAAGAPVPEPLLEALRWSSLLVLAAVLAVRLAAGHGPFVETCRAWLPDCGERRAAALDAAYHVLPVVALGLPRAAPPAWGPAAAAYAAMLAWYAASRDRVCVLYHVRAPQPAVDAVALVAAPAGAGALAAAGELVRALARWRAG